MYILEIDQNKYVQEKKKKKVEKLTTSIHAYPQI